MWRRLCSAFHSDTKIYQAWCEQQRNEPGLEQVVDAYRTLCRSHAGAVGHEGLVNLIPVLAPKYFLPCVSADSSPRSYLVKFTSDIRIPVHCAPISDITGCEAALLRFARPSFAASQKSRRNYSSCLWTGVPSSMVSCRWKSRKSCAV